MGERMQPPISSPAQKVAYALLEQITKAAKYNTPGHQ